MDRDSPGLEKILIHFSVQDQKLWNGPPWIWHLVEICEILLLHVLSSDAWKFVINLFPISWGPFGNVYLLFYLLKMQIWNGCNVLNIVGNPIKDINVNLSFLSSGSKVVECPPRSEKILNSFLGSGSKVVEWTPLELEKYLNAFLKFRIKSCGMDPPGYYIWWKFVEFNFWMYCPMMHAYCYFSFCMISQKSV